MRRRFVARMFLCIGLILLSLIMIGSSLMGIYFNKTRPVVPLRESREGDHVKATALRVVEVIDTKETRKKNRRLPGYDVRTTYYCLVEIEEVEGGLIIYTCSKDPDELSFPIKLDGRAYMPKDDLMQKADLAMNSYPDMSLYRFQIDNLIVSPAPVIVGIVIVVVCAAVVILSIMKGKSTHWNNY